MTLVVPVMSPMTSEVMTTEMVPSEVMAEIERRINRVGVQGIGIRADRVAAMDMVTVAVAVSVRMNLLDQVFSDEHASDFG